MLFVRSSLSFFSLARACTHTHRTILRGAPRTLVWVCLGWNRSAQERGIVNSFVLRAYLTCFSRAIICKSSTCCFWGVVGCPRSNSTTCRSFVSFPREAGSRVAHSQLSRHSFMAPWAKILGMCTLGFLRHGRYDSPNRRFVGGGSFVAAFQFGFDFELPGVFVQPSFDLRIACIFDPSGPQVFVQSQLANAAAEELRYQKSATKAFAKDFLIKVSPSAGTRVTRRLIFSFVDCVPFSSVSIVSSCLSPPLNVHLIAVAIDVLICSASLITPGMERFRFCSPVHAQKWVAFITSCMGSWRDLLSQLLTSRIV